MNKYVYTRINKLRNPIKGCVFKLKVVNMRAIFYVCLILFISGCATLPSDYYTNPNSAGYNESVFGAICEHCNRLLSFSAAQFNTNREMTCCYCGHPQNLQMAHNRFLYAQQQANAIANQQAAAAFGEAWRESQQANRQRTNQIIQGLFDYGSRQGTRTNPYHVKVE